jgi:hypothetical protein
MARIEGDRLAGDMPWSLSACSAASRRSSSSVSARNSVAQFMPRSRQRSILAIAVSPLLRLNSPAILPPYRGVASRILGDSVLGDRPARSPAVFLSSLLAGMVAKSRQSNLPCGFAILRRASGTVPIGRNEKRGRDSRSEPDPFELQETKRRWRFGKKILIGLVPHAGSDRNIL